MSVESASDLAALAARIDPLDRIEPGLGLFQTSAWVCPTAKVAIRRRNMQIRVLLGRSRNSVVAVFPFCVTNRLGVKIATLLGHPLSQYSDVWIDGSALSSLGEDALRNALAAAPDIDAFWFRRVRADSRLLKLLPGAGGEQLSQSAAPFADLTRYPDFDGYLKPRWKAHRNRNRLRRRAERGGPLKFEVVESGARAGELARIALRLKRAWMWSEYKFFGALHSQDWRQALIEMVEAPHSSIRPIVTALHGEGVIAAVEIGFVRKGRYTAFLGAVRPDCGAWSPSDLLMEDTIRWCFEQRLDCYDLLPPDDSYKLKWCNDATPVADWVVNRSPSGKLFMRCRTELLPTLAQGVRRSAAWLDGHLRAKQAK